MPERNTSSSAGARSRTTDRVRQTEGDPHRLARTYLAWRAQQASSGWRLRHWRGAFWMWDGTHYQRIEASDVCAEVTRAIKSEFDRWARRAAKKSKPAFAVSKVTTAAVTNVLQALASLVNIPSSVDQPAWLGRSRDRAPVIAMKNGLLDLERLLSNNSVDLRVHSPDWFSPVCLDFPYQPKAECPLFDAFLNRTFEGDEARIALVWEWMGYCLTFDVSLEKFMIAFGEGANGKSVFLNVLIALLGERNVSSVPLELFGDKFQLISTLGKLANVVSEIGEVDRLSEGHLKAYVSGNRMTLDRKFKSSIDTCPTARLTFTTNEVPKFRDKSGGIWRRLILLPFRVVVPEDERDPQLADKLKAELPGIFNKAIEGLRRLRENKRFTEAAACRQARDEHQSDSNPARAFLREFVRARPGAQIACQVLQQQFSFWCIANDFEGVNGRTFGKEVVRQFPSVKRLRGQRDPSGNRPWIYDGVEYVSGETATPAIPVARPRARPRPVSAT